MRSESTLLAMMVPATMVLATTVLATTVLAMTAPVTTVLAITVSPVSTILIALPATTLFRLPTTNCALAMVPGFTAAGERVELWLILGALGEDRMSVLANLVPLVACVAVDGEMALYHFAAMVTASAIAFSALSDQ